MLGGDSIDTMHCMKSMAARRLKETHAPLKINLKMRCAIPMQYPACILVQQSTECIFLLKHITLPQNSTRGCLTSTIESTMRMSMSTNTTSSRALRACSDSRKAIWAWNWK